MIGSLFMLYFGAVIGEDRLNALCSDLKDEYDENEDEEEATS
jgi:hypothetical protein